jgi:hypothetical protein
MVLTISLTPNLNPFRRAVLSAPLWFNPLIIAATTGLSFFQSEKFLSKAKNFSIRLNSGRFSAFSWSVFFAAFF